MIPAVPPASLGPGRLRAMTGTGIASKSNFAEKPTPRFNIECKNGGHLCAGNGSQVAGRESTPPAKFPRTRHFGKIVSSLTNSSLYRAQKESGIRSDSGASGKEAYQTARAWILRCPPGNYTTCLHTCGRPNWDARPPRQRAFPTVRELWLRCIPTVRRDQPDGQELLGRSVTRNSFGLTWGYSESGA
jgi:hypothetical protein